ncbi:cytochrome P450 [Amycolatopsis endophytica]|uniref:Cytochrome P450 n=1 Tax=Amycolatopsis endophytica TaxID=860233 RepID=A0A853B5H7_9PSEU|nr:cytochrome P450 [Amycolatopsis endophytica]NYI90493.1 cytochrome P450 [Amycolatopsis endophytica]
MSGLPRASVAETAKVFAGVVGPTLAGGVIKRRPRVMSALEKMQADASAVRVMQRLRGRHGEGLLRLAVPGRSFALVLSPEDVGRVLAGSPEPFTPANLEKRAALSQFQPHGVLISREPERARRREWNERVLETDRPTHHLAPSVEAKVAEEFAALGPGPLDWDAFAPVFWRAVRRVVFGDHARDDHVTTDLLGKLRLAGNWAYLLPRRRASREEFLGRVRSLLAQAPPDSLAGSLSADDDVASQIGHWLFAFDAAAMVAFRTLGLLATHPAQRQKARQDIAAGPDPDYLRACVLDTIRLWPTTPAILRDTTRDLDWDGHRVPSGTGLLIFTPLFHRDDSRLPFAHSFVPEIWLDGRARKEPALVPFSAGPGECPARNLVLFTTSVMLSTLIRDRDYTVDSTPRPAPGRPLPATFDNFSLRLTAHP